VRSDVFNAVAVIRDREKEAPGFVDAGLPQVPALVVFLGVERWVLEVRGQKPQLLLKGRRTCGGASFNSSMTRSDKTIFIA